jgi:hypothetical protein
MVSISVKTETGKTRIFNNLSIEQCICLPITLVLVMLSFTVPPASADYNYDGVPFTDQLDEVKQGIVKGGVYVDGGHGVGPSPYTQSFNVPEGTVEWAQLYVGVWGGSEVKTGSVAVTFNGEELETLELEGEADTNPNVYCSGHGVYWIVYDVTLNTTSGPVDAIVTTSGIIDGKVYGVVLAAVYEDPCGQEVQYWINEGNVNLHDLDQSCEHGTNDEAVTEFAGTVDVDKFAAARLAVVYLTGTPGLNDYLYFNDEKLCDGDNCNDIANSKKYFDFKTFDVTDHLDKKANKAKFELGDEDYLHPVLAVLTLHTEAEVWIQDGVSLHTIEHGTVNGGIYVGGGHGMEYTTTYTQNFTMPNGSVEWARLYVSAKDTPWINVSLNGHLLGNYTDLTSNPKVYANYKPDRGMYWAYYDNAAEWIVNGSNTATANLGSEVGLNTKSWGIMLIAVYEGGDEPEHIEYWVNEGNLLLHGDHLPFVAHRNTTNTLFADINDLDDVTDAALWTAYIWGSEESELQPHDTLWFNSELIADDASDGAGTDDQGSSWRGACFDLDKKNVTHSLARDNVVSFDRGGDSLLCPVGAVLVLKHGSETAASGRTVQLGATILPAVSLEVNPDAVDFGTLAPGGQSNTQMLTLSNAGSCTIAVTASVTDSAADLFVDGLLLDSDSWSAFSRSIANGGAADAGVVLDVPDEYAGVGTQEGVLIFWAETA